MAMSGWRVSGFLWILLLATNLAAESVKVDLSEVDERCPIKVKQDENWIAVTWSTDRGHPPDPAVLTISRDPSRPLFANLQIASEPPNVLARPAKTWLLA